MADHSPNNGALFDTSESAPSNSSASDSNNDATPNLRVYVRDDSGICYRLFGAHKIADVDLLLYERVGPWYVEVTSRTSPVDGEEIAAGEWDAALAKFVKRAREKEAEAERNREAAKYGIQCGKAIIVRCTRARWVDSLGRQWNRTNNWKNGIRVGSGAGCYPDGLSSEALAQLHAAAAGRDRVDFVAERKSASQAES